MNRKLILACAMMASMAFASEVPFVGGQIVIDNPGTYTLTEPATVTGVRFNAEATVEGSAVLTLTAPAVVSGKGALLVPLAGENGLTVENRRDAPSAVFPQKSERVLIWSGVPFAAIRDVQADIAGYWVGATTTDAAFRASRLYYAENETGTEATMQFHTCIPERSIAFKAKFTCEDGNTYCQIVWARHADLDKTCLDWDQMSIGTNYNEPFSMSTICLANIRALQDMTLSGQFPSGAISFNAARMTIAPTADLTIMNLISGKMDELVFKGDNGAGNPTAKSLTFQLGDRNTYVARQTILDAVDVSLTNNGGMLPDNGTLVLTNGATLNAGYSYVSGQLNKFLSRASTAVVHAGSKLTLRNSWILENDAKIEVNEGEVSIPGQQYLQHLTLSNGGKVSGDKYVVGYQTADSYTRTRGETPCEISCAIRGAKDPNKASLVHVFDTEADLHLTGGLSDYTPYNGISWTKRGLATLFIEGDGSSSQDAGACGSFTVEEGAIVLGGDYVLTRTNAFTLAGGTLDGGAHENRLGVLNLTASSTITIENGILTFSDSSDVIWSEGAILNIIGKTDGLTSGHVRFLDGGLTTAQLKALRYNGRRHIFEVDANGWLTSNASGLAITIR